MSEMKFEEKTFEQQVNKLISLFISFRIEKKLVKSIKFKAEIIYFNENTWKWKCFSIQPKPTRPNWQNKMIKTNKKLKSN